jgi:proteasome lid subunit RPN8/RPN11
MPEDQNEIVETSKEGKVIIKMEAFKNILTHVLEHGNIYLDYKTQAMGFCIGNFKPDEKVFELVTTIPITHGDGVEIGFSERDRAALSNIKSLHPNQVIGWYHSHPGFDIFFSKADKASNLYFQTEQNPLGFGIVIDPSKIKKDKSFGIDVFRLKDFKVGAHGDYVRVNHEIEFPNSLEYFNWIKTLMEDSQMKTPILASEQPEMKEHERLKLQEIPIPKDEIVEKTSFDEGKIEPVIKGLMEGTKTFSDSFIDTYRSELTAWEREFNQGTVHGTKKIKDSLKQMGLTISDGLEKVENFFDRVFKTRIKEFNDELYSLVRQRSEKQKELKSILSKLKETLMDDVRNKIDEAITGMHGDLMEIINTISNQVNKINEENEAFDRLLVNSNDLISKITKQMENELEDINRSIETITQPFESNILDTYEKVLSEIDPLQANHSEIRNLMEKFQKIISDLRALKK